MRRGGIQEQPARFGGESQNGRGFYGATTRDGAALYRGGTPGDRLVNFQTRQDVGVEYQKPRWTSEPATTTDSRAGAIADTNDRANPPAEVVFPYATANRDLRYDRTYRPDPQGSTTIDNDRWTTTTQDRSSRRSNSGSDRSGQN